MPKVRKISAGAIEFEVSPWQTKKRKYDQVQGKSADGLVRNEESRHDMSQGPSVDAMDSNDASQSAAAQQPLYYAPQIGAKQGSALEQDQPAGRSEHILSSLGIFNVVDDKAELSPAIREAMQHVLQQHPDSDSSPPESTTLQLSNQLEGTACLAWLPDGQVFGDLQGPEGEKALSIRGREVMSERECTRDAEWKLLHVRLRRSSSCQEVGFLVEKTGCDAATLSAPCLLHGSEAGWLREATLQSDPTVHLSFACEELLSDEAAEGKLAARRPELCGKGAIVNIGNFVCGGSSLGVLDHPSKVQHELYDSDLDV